MYKHIIISRVALKLNYKRNDSWDVWSSNRLKMFNEYTRQSLKQQTNQNFTLISLVDESLVDLGDVLDNEIIIKLPSLEHLDPGSEVLSVIKDSINGLGIFEVGDILISSRIDSDDAYNSDFVDIIQKEMVNRKLKINTFIDIINHHQYDLVNNIQYISNRYHTNTTSPFVSLISYINEKGFVDKLVTDYQHTHIKDKFKGIKLSGLSPLQVIHGNNVMNKIDGKETPLNLKKFNLKNDK